MLHLVGATGDHGGILSVIRSIQSSTETAATAHFVWVNEAFRQTRSPTLELRFSRHALDEDSNHLRLLCRSVRAWPGLRRLLSKERFDVVHAHTRGTFPLSCAHTAFAQTPRAIFTNHTYARRTGMYRRAGSWSRLTTVLLTPNMARHYGLTPSENIRLISACGADTFFDQSLLPRPTAAGSLRLVGIGNLVRWKRWDLIVRALALLPAEIRRIIHFDVWGPIPDETDAHAFAQELKSLTNSLGLNDTVRFPGATNQVSEMVTAADVFVLPSTNEPCSVALIEAMACGRPVLASRSGGNVDIVQDGQTGLLFTPDSAEDLARCLRRFLDGSFVPASPEVIRESVRQRSAAVVGAEYLRLYRELAAAH